MNSREFIGGAALCVVAGLWIGGAFAAAVNGTAPANLEALHRVAAAERYEITHLKAEPEHVFVAYVLRPTAVRRDTAGASSTGRSRRPWSPPGLPMRIVPSIRTRSRTPA